MTEARTRRSSGFSPAGLSVLALLIAAGLGYVAFARTKPPAVAPDNSATASIAGTCTKKAEFAGVLRDIPDARLRGNQLAVDEGFWAHLSADDKTRLAIVAYCQIAAADGTGTLVVTGLHDGVKKAGMVDGNYLD